VLQGVATACAQHVNPSSFSSLMHVLSGLRVAAEIH
jgi:hypothetical protein